MSDPVEWIEHKLAQVEKVVKEEPRKVEGERMYPATWEDEPLSCIDDDYHHPLAGDPLTIITLAAATRELLELHPNYDGRCDACVNEVEPYVEAVHFEPFPCPTVKALAKGWGWADE